MQIRRCLGAQGINAVLARVQNTVVAKGFVTTRILAAPQNLASGELMLTVIPGRIRAIRFSPDSTANGPDAQPGESDLVIRYRQALPFRLSLTVDDGGSKSTDKYQGGVTLRRNA